MKSWKVLGLDQHPLHVISLAEGDGSFETGRRRIRACFATSATTGRFNRGWKPGKSRQITGSVPLMSWLCVTHHLDVPCSPWPAANRKRPDWKRCACSSRGKPSESSQVPAFAYLFSTSSIPWISRMPSSFASTISSVGKIFLYDVNYLLLDVAINCWIIDFGM